MAISRRPAGQAILLHLAFFQFGAGATTFLQAQGQLVFDNRVPQTIVAPIYGPDPDDPYRQLQGNGPEGFPSGPQIYGGMPLQGSGFTAQLFAGPAGTPAENLTALLPSIGFGSGVGSGYVVAPARAVTVPGVEEEETAQLQLRVWANQGGSVTNWSQVLEQDAVWRGQSSPFVSPPLGGVFFPPPNLLGLESFNLTLGGQPSLVDRLLIQLIQTNESWAVQLRFQYQQGSTYEITAGSNFDEWEVIGQPTAVDEMTMEFVDLDSPLFPRRFYRLQIQPSP